MEETVGLLHAVLSYSVPCFVLCAILGLFVSILSKDYQALKKRFKALSPIYYMFFSIIFLCGIILLALKHFALSLDNIIMIIVWIAILWSGIKAYKLSKNKALFSQFKNFLYKKYLGDIALCALVYLLRGVL